MSDPKELLPALTTALQRFGQSLSKVALAKVRYELEPDAGPDYSPEPTWKLVAHLICYGDLKIQDPNPEGGDHLQGAEPIEVVSCKWEAQASSFVDVVAALVGIVEGDLAKRLDEQEKKLVSATDALGALRGEPSP